MGAFVLASATDTGMPGLRARPFDAGRSSGDRRLNTRQYERRPYQQGEPVGASHFGQIVELSTAGFIRRAPIERPLKLH
jgi:hypothetical protein